MATKAAERCPYCKGIVEGTLQEHLKWFLDAPRKGKPVKKPLATFVEDGVAAAIRSMGDAK